MRGRGLRGLGVLGAAGMLGLLALPFVLGRLGPVRSAVLGAIALMRGGGALGAATYFGAYAAGVLLTAPIWIFSGMAGYAYGPLHGLLLASPANLTATTLAFLIGRFAFSARLGSLLGRSPRWGAVRRAVEAEPFRIGMLLRLSPVAPQNLLSYGFSLTPMRLSTFVAVTWLGLLPITCFHVYVGSLVHDFAQLLDGTRPPLGAWGWAVTGTGLVLGLMAVVAAARLGQRALARHGV